MKREFGVEANVGKPQVAYRETIRKPVSDVEGKFVRQSGGKGQYGHVVFTLEPQEAGKGFEFVDEIKGGVVPREYIPAVEKGVVEALTSGVLAGYPVVDVKVRLTFGSASVRAPAGCVRPRRSRSSTATPARTRPSCSKGAVSSQVKPDSSRHNRAAKVRIRRTTARSRLMVLARIPFVRRCRINSSSVP